MSSFPNVYLRDLTATQQSELIKLIRGCWQYAAKHIGGDANLDNFLLFYGLSANINYKYYCAKYYNFACNMVSIDLLMHAFAAAGMYSIRDDIAAIMQSRLHTQIQTHTQMQVQTRSMRTAELEEEVKRLTELAVIRDKEISLLTEILIKRDEKIESMSSRTKLLHDIVSGVAKIVL